MIQETHTTPVAPHRARVILTAAGLVAAAFGVLSLAFAGLGTHWGWWGFRTGISVMQWDFCLGLAAVALSGIAVILRARRRERVLAAILGLALGVVAAAVPLNAYRIARSVPPIHDITTDTANPPQFVAILPLRANALNSAVYGGPGIASQQAKAYPDIAPVRLNVPPTEALDRTLGVARAMGWQIVATDAAQGRIEATATTAWFGFKDDVVIRVAPDNDGSRVDIRSESRVGSSDLGTNAKRIREFIARLRHEAAPNAAQ